MKIFFHQNHETPDTLEEDFVLPTLRDDIEKTRKALEIAYAGFDNAIDDDMIDCYIFQINSLLKRYSHLAALAGSRQEAFQDNLYQQSPIRALVGHVFS